MVLVVHVMLQSIGTGNHDNSRENDVETPAEKDQCIHRISNGPVDEEYGHLDFCAPLQWKALVENRMDYSIFIIDNQYCVFWN